MLMVESRTGRSAVRKSLLTAALGTLLGIQAWQVAVLGLSVPFSRLGSACLVLCHLTLGLTVGLTRTAAQWWKRGLLLGVLFGVPTAVGALRIARLFSVAALVEAATAGLILALIADTAYRPGESGPRDTRPAKPRIAPLGPVSRRLAQEKESLERLARERARRKEPAYGKSAEERIVWRELLDLELQDIDERVSRIRKAAGEGPRSKPDPS